MSTQEYIHAIFHKLKKDSWYLLLGGLLVMGIFVFYSLQKPPTYTSKASIFPLNSGSELLNGPSTLSALFGGGDNSKSFSDDASINIIELAQSRTTREEVAAIKDTSKGNKIIAELLLDDINNHQGLLESKIIKPESQTELIIWAGDVLKDGLSASVNKNNSFVLSYTGRSPELVRTISYGFIDKISTFYIDLKIEKAKRDFEFASSKVDSLREVMNSKDNQLIAIDKRTLFTNTSRLEFTVPTENLMVDKQMIRQQYANAVANQQNAAYKLQKATPVIKVLDRPEPPYIIQNNSPLIFGILGFLIGIIIAGLFITSKLIIRFLKHESSKAIFGTSITPAISPLKK